MSAPRLGRAPSVLLVPAVLGVALLAVPLVTLVLATPWRTLPEHLASQARHDPLTRLANRRAGDAFLAQALDVSRRQGRPRRLRGDQWDELRPVHPEHHRQQRKHDDDGGQGSQRTDPAGNAGIRLPH